MFVPLCIAGAVVVAATAASLYVLTHRQRHCRRMTVCPVCGSPADKFAVADDSLKRQEQHEDDLVVCGNIVSEVPFEECSFTVPRWQFDMPWLRFAGVGGTCSAGQTTWNAACSSWLRPFLITEKVRVESLPSAGQDDVQRDWQGIECSKYFPRATCLAQPRPWLLRIALRTRYSPRRIVAVSDFAGEIPGRQTLEDHCYRNLLDKDGHFFFIDLANPSGDRHQLEVFHTFLVNLRAHRGLRNTNGRLTPIAVCIGKVDCLPSLRDEILDSGPADESTTLAAIRRRHELVLKHSALFPCVKSLNSRLHDECGRDGYMFFPMASVGWSGSDLRAGAAITPYGVVDPLLWLLYASGVKVLKP